MSEFLLAAAGFVLAMVALGLVRVLRGPDDADRLMAGQLLGSGGIAALLLGGAAIGDGDRVAHLGGVEFLDAGDDEADLAGAQFEAGHRLRCKHPDLLAQVLRAFRHQQYFVLGA